MWYSILTLVAPMGWYFYFKHRRIAPSHIPLLICSLHMLTLFAAAFIGGLLWGSALLTSTGCLLLIWLAVTRKFRFSLPTPGLIVFLIGLVWSALSTLNTVSYAWSDVSHWMRYVKALVADGSYPTMLTHPEISYSSYPPGSALFISHLLEHLPQKYLSGKAICAMRILQLACISAVVSPLEKVQCRKSVQTIAALFIGAIIFSLLPYNDTIMVDLLLGLFAAALLSVCLYAKQDSASLAVLVPASACLCLIKNSSLIFLFFALIFYLVLEKRKGNIGKKALIGSLAMIAGAAITFGGWTIYSHAAYPDVESSSQALSLSRYISIFISHSPEFYPQLLAAFFKLLLYPGLCVSLVFWTVLAGLGAAMLSAKRFVPKAHYHHLLTCISLILIFDVVYIISLLLSYTFSFTEKEALIAASFDRYFASVLVSHIAVCFYIILELFSAMPKRQYAAGLLAALTICVAILAAVPLFSLHQMTERSESGIVRKAADDWYIRQLCSAAEDHLSMHEDEQYVLWLYNRTDEPAIDPEYKVSIYTRIAVSSYFCLPENNARTLDITINDPKDVSYVLRSFTNRENAVVVLTDTRPAALEAAQKLNIPIYYGSGVAH